MKKLVLVALAVLLAMPVLSHAGAVTNKWDMTIGGYVAMHAAWISQEQNAVSGYKTAARRGSTEDNTPNMNWNSEGRLNFMIKGPDAFGAKTSGRFEFDFLGSSLASSGTFKDSGNDTGTVNSRGNNSYLQPRHTYLQLDWANDTLLIGNTWFGWMATIPAGGFTLASLPNAAVPSRSQQIRWDHKFGKDIKVSLGVENPVSNAAWQSGTSNAHTYSLFPDVFGVFEYTSAACGKVGPNMLKIGASGVYGREKIRYNTGRNTTFADEDIWGAALYAYIPIIPERANNKAGAMGLSIGGMRGQGIAKYFGNAIDYTYLHNDTDRDDYSRARAYGYWALGEVYMTNTLKLALAYTESATDVSRAYRIANASTAERNRLYNIALIYDPNPALRFGVEAGRIDTRYMRSTAGSVRDNYYNMYRFVAAYFF